MSKHAEVEKEMNIFYHLGKYIISALGLFPEDVDLRTPLWWPGPSVSLSETMKEIDHDKALAARLRNNGRCK